MINRHAKVVKLLYFFCLEYGPRSHLLAVTQDWVASFENFGLRVVIVTNHYRRKDESPRQDVIELGGGSLVRRICALKRILPILFSIWQNRGSCSVFYHMNHKVIAIQGLLVKIFGVHQTLWYSHAEHDKWLHLSNCYADLVLTTSPEAYPLRHPLIVSVGQAVSLDRFHWSERNFNMDSPLVRILSIGRISKAKNLEKIFLSLKDRKSDKFIEVSFYGPILDEGYAEDLRVLAEHSNMGIKFWNSLPYERLPSILKMYDFYFTGTNKAIDKAATEAAMAGLIVLSDNMSLLRILGLEKSNTLEIQQKNSISEQFDRLVKMDSELLTSISKRSSQNARSNLSIENAINVYKTSSGLRFGS